MDDRDEVEEDANTLTFGPGKPDAHSIGVFTSLRSASLRARIWSNAPVAHL